MTQIVWDKQGERTYKTGVDHGVLYIPDASGVYDNGVAWNGLTAVTESPSGAEASAQYADNIKYLNLISAEEFSATVEAFTYPLEFAQFDGTAFPVTGVAIGQQPRRAFGMSYRTLLGNDLLNTEFGYEIHLIYGATAAPSEKAYSTVNDSPEALAFSWELSTNPVAVPGHKPTATLTIDSTKVPAAALKTLEDMLYGTAGNDPRLPTPEEVIAIFSGTVTSVTPTKPAMAANVITIPATAGVVYKINGVVKPAGALPAITENVMVKASPAIGYKFPPVVETSWVYVKV